MDDRDHFAAAALTGLLVHANDDIDEETLDTPSDIAYTAYQMADAMLRERGKSKPPEPCAWKDGIPVAWHKKTNHDAAPAARANAESVAPQPTASDRSGNPTSHSGTGNRLRPECESDRLKPVKDGDSDRSKPISDERLGGND